MASRPACPRQLPQCGPSSAHRSHGPSWSPSSQEKPETITQNTGSGAQSWSGFQGAEAAPRRPQNPGATAPYK